MTSAKAEMQGKIIDWLKSCGCEESLIQCADMKILVYNDGGRYVKFVVPTDEGLPNYNEMMIDVIDRGLEVLDCDNIFAEIGLALARLGFVREIRDREKAEKEKSAERKVDDELTAIDAEKCEYLVPCYRFRGMDFGAQYEKVKSEVREMFASLADWLVSPSRRSRESLLMECADVQVAIETLMYQVGADEAERREARRKVYEKNDRRGYYDEKSK